MASRPLIGAHLPLGKGFAACVESAHDYGMTALQVFTSSPRMWRGAPCDSAKADALRVAREKTGLRAVVSHDTYLVNLSAANPEIAEKSYVCLRDELIRSAGYEIPYVVSHLGSSARRDRDGATQDAANAVRRILDETPPTVTLLAETTAGAGSALNATFEEIARLIELAGSPDRLGVCLDTCHVFAAGYDLRNEESYQATFTAFSSAIGLERLKVIHVNDSVHALGSRKDRHANLGKGHIGEEAFRRLARDPRFANVPLILETPQENDAFLDDFRLLWHAATV